jgi:signal peptidase II
MRSSAIRVAVFLTVLLLTAGFDQGTKEWARALPAGSGQPVIDGVWDWQVAQNTGAAFSLFASSPEIARVVLSLLALGALVAIIVVALRTRPEQRLTRIALALVAGGALGNLVDRVRLGSVTDFIKWHYHDRVWPLFNVADVALVIGAVLLVIDGLRRSKPATT